MAQQIPVRILHTNDLHSQVSAFGPDQRGGVARLAQMMADERFDIGLQGGTHVTLDGGDQREGTLHYTLDGGAGVYSLMADMGYDAIQVGNHDHLFGAQVHFDILESAWSGLTTPPIVLWGNVNPSTLDTTGLAGQLTVAPEVAAAFENGFTDLLGSFDGSLMDPATVPGHRFQQATIIDRGGVRIGLFGLDTDEELYTVIVGAGELAPTASDLSENLTFYDPVTHAYATKMIEYLEDPDGDPLTDDGADLIVATAHLGPGTSIPVANNAVAPSGRRIDVIVDGHSHTRLNTAVPVDHGDGRTTWIVQADSRGAFLGVVDLMVDTATDQVILIDAHLEAVLPGSEDPVTAASAAALDALVEIAWPGAQDTALAVSDGLLEGPGSAQAPLGLLVADSFRWHAGQQGLPVDIAVAASFQFRGDLPEGAVTAYDAQAVIPQHNLTSSPAVSHTLHATTVQGGIVDAPGLHDLLAMIPGSNPPQFQGVSRVELFLETVFSLSDVVEGLGATLGFDVGGGVQGYLDGLQWSGLQVEVDMSAGIFERVDPATVTINGVPLVGNEDQDFTFGVDSVIAPMLGSFIDGFILVEAPVGSGQIEGLMGYDPATADTGIVLWEALSSYLASLGIVQGADWLPDGTQVAPVGPDAALFGPQVEAWPSPVAPGQPVHLLGEVRNLGRTGITSARVSLTTDPTPLILTDNPDGWTDAQTGASLDTSPLFPTGPIAAHDGTFWGVGPFDIMWSVPDDYPLGQARPELSVQQVVSDDPTRPETLSGNNTVALGGGMLVQVGDSLETLIVPVQGGTAQFQINGRPGDGWVLFAGGLGIPDDQGPHGIQHLDPITVMALGFGSIGPTGVGGMAVPVPAGAEITGSVVVLQVIHVHMGWGLHVFSNAVGPYIL